MPKRHLTYLVRRILCLVRGRHRLAFAQRASISGPTEPIGFVCTTCWNPHAE